MTDILPSSHRDLIPRPCIVCKPPPYEHEYYKEPNRKFPDYCAEYDSYLLLDEKEYIKFRDLVVEEYINNKEEMDRWLTKKSVITIFYTKSVNMRSTSTNPYQTNRQLDLLIITKDPEVNSGGGGSNERKIAESDIIDILNIVPTIKLNRTPRFLGMEGAIGENSYKHTTVTYPYVSKNKPYIIKKTGYYEWKLIRSEALRQKVMSNKRKIAKRTVNEKKECGILTINDFRSMIRTLTNVFAKVIGIQSYDIRIYSASRHSCLSRIRELLVSFTRINWKKFPKLNSSIRHVRKEIKEWKKYRLDLYMNIEIKRERHGKKGEKSELKDEKKVMNRIIKLIGYKPPTKARRSRKIA